MLFATVIAAMNTLLSISSAFGGFACMSNPCVHGVCMDDLNTTYSCYCIDGYTGVQCQTNWNECWSSPCKNGGICHDGIASFNCSCPLGFVGEICEVNYNECESNPCQNNGTCWDVTDGYTCDCPAGYSGFQCELDVAVCNTTSETRCANGGVCVEGPGVSFKCRCQPGWEGFLCDVEQDECISAPCQNGAVCIDLHDDYSCACLFGYTGRNCEETIMRCTNNPCMNSALCLNEDNHPVCYCVPDYHGDRCQYQYDECQLGPKCTNGGTCLDGIDSFMCSCPPRLTGVVCECLILEDNELDCNFDLSSYTVFTETVETSTITTIGTTIYTTTGASTSTQGPTTEASTSTQGPTTETTVFPNTTTTYTTEIISTVPTEETTPTETTTELSTTTTTTILTETTTSETYSQTYSEAQTSTSLMNSTTELPTSVTTFISELTETQSSSPDQFFSTATYSFIANLSTTPFTELTTVVLTDLTTFDGDNLTLSTEITTFFTEEPSTVIGTHQTDLATAQPIPLFPNCTSFESHCRNGGSCVYTPDGHKCLCPFDAEGVLCELRLGINKPAFRGDSFLSYRLNNDTNMSIEFKAKTLSSNGLIFYANFNNNYMMLYIENALLKFRFSCGFQTMLLSELKVPANNGLEMAIKADFQLNRNLTHCTGSIKINNTYEMSGHQIAVVNRFLKSPSYLMLGGWAHEYFGELFPISGGFVGCMNDLKINRKDLNIFRDAEDGFQITECSALACLSSPCNNEATCVVKGEEWQCNCKNGYLGTTCEISVCDNNPCQFGGTCLSHSGSGYICLCPIGKHGRLCENDLMITEPYFSSSILGYSSFVAYPIPSGISIDMELKFKIVPNTMEQISILMFMGQTGPHDSFSDHMVVSFVKGYIMLTWNLGSGPRRIFTSKPMTKGKNNYLVRLGRFGRRAWLSVDQLGNITGRSPGNLIQLNVAPLLYIGGHHSRNFSTLPHDLPLHTGFSGCIYDVELKSGSVTIPLQASRQSVGRGVGQCGTTECHEQACQNGGACLHHGGTFACLCRDEYFGPQCTLEHNPCNSFAHNCSEGSTCVPLLSGYECDCPLGRTGRFCEKIEALTDVHFTGKRSFLAIEPVKFEPSRFTIDLELKTFGDRGLILYVGKETTNFVCLSLQSGLLELWILLGKRMSAKNELFSLRSNKLLTKGTWHKIRIGMYGRRVYLTVDNIINTGLLNKINFVSLANEAVFIGGLPDMSLLPDIATTSLPVPFIGCIRQLEVNFKHIPLIIGQITKARNVIDCDGTPCGGDVCDNGGTCWLDSGLKPHCTCVEPYFGEKCANISSCFDQQCQNRGRCVDHRCHCAVGWTGAFCETEISVSVPEFFDNSYLVIRKFGNKKRALGDLKIERLFLNFTTASPNGLILWSSKGDNFFGVGLDNGHIKLAYSWMISQNHIVDIPYFEKVSDGLWHSVDITLGQSNLRLVLDEVLVHENDVKSLSISTDGVFYLGGFPSNGSIFNITGGIFRRHFWGCIESVGINDENFSKNFAEYEAENIDACHVP